MTILVKVRFRGHIGRKVNAFQKEFRRKVSHGTESSLDERNFQDLGLSIQKDLRRMF